MPAILSWVAGSSAAPFLPRGERIKTPYLVVRTCEICYMLQIGDGPAGSRILPIA
jgi:hypothetical protein